MKVRDVMTYGVISVPEGASIAEASRPCCARG